MKYKTFLLHGIITFICCLSLTQHIKAQGNKKSIHFTSINSVGLLNGQIASTFTMQTINGISFKNASVGIGAGIDNYGYRTIPVFVDLRKTFGKTAIKPVLFADFGIGYPIKTDNSPEQWSNEFSKTIIKNSFCGEWGLGIEKTIGNSSLFVTASYSYKKYAYTQNIYWFYGPNGTNVARQDYHYNRIALRMGYRF